jgi:hypothetical protein
LIKYWIEETEEIQDSIIQSLEILRKSEIISRKFYENIFYNINYSDIIRSISSFSLSFLQEKSEENSNFMMNVQTLKSSQIYTKQNLLISVSEIFTSFHFKN